MSLRFPKTARLSRSADFARLKAEGVSTPGRHFVFSVLYEGEGAARVGLITSRRVGGAVQRNRVRRRLRELFRACRPRLKQGLWLVVIARQRAAEATFAALQAEWEALCRRAGILQETPCSS